MEKDNSKQGAELGHLADRSNNTRLNSIAELNGENITYTFMNSARPGHVFREADDALPFDGVLPGLPGAFPVALSDRPNLTQYQLQHYQSDPAIAHPTLE
ncbi:MAG: hypothetical protein FRX49_02899 [Trebouxia sp. A1-2]|nr:MAG: hypothetical protein FRX49_02899 [Trebouxia sp. A1-2]